MYSSTSETLQLSGADTSSSDEIQCSVTVTDSDGGSASLSDSVTVENVLPTTPEISLSPDPATTSDALTVNIDTVSTDFEGGTISYQYEWYLNNVLSSSHTTDTVPSSATTKGETWKVVVTPNDGLEDGAAVEAEITISNTVPTISSISITPSGTTYNDDTLTCSVVATDPDQTLIPVYTWMIGSNVVVIRPGPECRGCNARR